MSIGDCRLPSVHKLQSGLMRPQNDGPDEFSKYSHNLILNYGKLGKLVGRFSLPFSMQHKVGITRNSRLAIQKVGGGWWLCTKKLFPYFHPQIDFLPRKEKDRRWNTWEMGYVCFLNLFSLGATPKSNLPHKNQQKRVRILCTWYSVVGPPLLPPRHRGKGNWGKHEFNTRIIF